MFGRGGPAGIGAGSSSRGEIGGTGHVGKAPGIPIQAIHAIIQVVQGSPDGQDQLESGGLLQSLTRDF
ncbi:MAG: hypothetical protein IT437_04985 [Phycisphaerales bacterium]|nr:hypothetical protein [Phycisphaerales bacterium]